MIGRRSRTLVVMGFRALVSAFWLLVLSLVVLERAALAYTPPPIAGAVNDGANVLGADERAKLEARLKAHREAHGHEIVVFTVASLGGESIEDVAYGAFNGWKIGKQGKDNGVLLVIAPNERKTRIETGKGVGGEITDLQSKRILSERVGPRLKEGKFYEGISAGVESIASLLTGGPLVPDGGTETKATETKPSGQESIPPTSVFVDTTGSFPEGERARFVAAYEARVKAKKAAFAVIVVPDARAAELPSLCGWNAADYQKALPNVMALVVTTRSGKRVVGYAAYGADGPGTKTLPDAMSALSTKMQKERGAAGSETVLVDGLLVALGELDIELPGFWDDREKDGTIVFFIMAAVLLAILFFAWLTAKLGLSSGGGGGGGGGSGGSSCSGGSSYSGGSSSSGGGGGGYSGGGGSSGGGGASDSY